MANPDQERDTYGRFTQGFAHGAAGKAPTSKHPHYLGGCKRGLVWRMEDPDDRDSDPGQAAHDQFDIWNDN